MLSVVIRGLDQFFSVLQVTFLEEGKKEGGRVFFQQEINVDTHTRTRTRTLMFTFRQAST